MNPVRSIRTRYVIGLSALALTILAIFFLMNDTISRQEHYGKVINIAGNQVGLTNRIAFFTSQIEASDSEEDYRVAIQQVGRAINAMRKNHLLLLDGDPEQNIPLIETEKLYTLYFDPDFGLDIATQRFLEQASQIATMDFGELSPNSASYVYVVNYGPYVLENLQNAAVTEYELFAADEINRLQLLEQMALGTALLVLVLEAMFIFRPLERKVQDAFLTIQEQNETLKKTSAEVNKSYRARLDFIANMSHEFRTPLNAIIGFSETLKSGIYGAMASPKQLESVEIVHQSGVHMLNLVNDVLELGAAESGTMVFTEECLSLKDLVTDAKQMISPLALEADISVVAVDSALGSISIRADRRRVLQVLLNVLSNAVKFTDPGGTITIRYIGDRNQQVGLSISDTGIGMTPSEIEKAQERFGQNDPKLRRKQVGTGLGIPLAIELMERHGGALKLESEKGVGTLVSLLFPADRVLASNNASRNAMTG